MEMRKAGKSEIHEAAMLLREYWKSRGMNYSQKWAENYIKIGHKTEIKKDMFFVAKKGGKVIGTISIVVYEGGVAELRDFVVDPEFRGKGIGKQVFKNVLCIVRKQKTRKVYFYTFPSYTKFYRKFGFKKEGVLKSHYAKGEDLVIMSKFLE
ncbi:MAG: GNAT family N-acetyltransferase [Candidatus Aenigmarchaeota archaeon]|nr:GNAT family N-acetyltransferase [Candidatus Aenigmarchaeota archaeon]